MHRSRRSVHHSRKGLRLRLCSGNIVWTARCVRRCSDRPPFAGMGETAPLRRNPSGWWSRRITGTHRLVYRMKGKGEDQLLEALPCRWHYHN
ncbi:type II toxin-antitoxin system YoeB family toxin [Methylobacterium brachiatum]|uniref:Type II toxin-antitoxin system YoeB family toxin n=1 Tax=Methylobacterium brachiatum TaxID=269660 RepID=A0ABV1R375_9HYPH